MSWTFVTSSPSYSHANAGPASQSSVDNLKTKTETMATLLLQLAERNEQLARENAQLREQSNDISAPSRTDADEAAQGSDRKDPATFLQVV